MAVSSTLQRKSLRPLLLLGIALTRRGTLARISIAIVIGTLVGFVLLGISLAMDGSVSALPTVPILASSALAYGGGVLLAFSSAAHALRRDRSEGIRHLLESRGVGLVGYLVMRVGGLSALLALLVGGATLIAGLVGMALAPRAAVVPKMLLATMASLVFAVAFAAVMAAVAVAAVGARSRVGGYLFLLGVLLVPELVAEALSNALPESVTEILAIPSALNALRAGLSPGSLEPLRAVRGLLSIAIFTTLALLLVRREVVVLGQREAPR